MLKMFEGIRVVDVTNNIAGPFGPAMMADLGADVIKVERPQAGDDTRAWPPFTEDHESASFMWYNRGKRSITLALNTPEGQEIARALMTTADVIVESNKPGSMAKFGLAYEHIAALNPRVIYCSVSAYGQSEPYSHKPGYDMMAQAMSGLMDMTGESTTPPYKAGFSLADFNGGVYAFGSICAALFHRERTGQGQHIDVALLDCMAVHNEHFERAVMGDAVTRQGNQHTMIAPFGFYQHRPSGQLVFVGAFGPRHWPILFRLIGKDAWVEDPGFATNPQRVARRVEITEAVEQWFDSFADVAAICVALDAAGLANSRVYSVDDVIHDEHLHQRGTIDDFTLTNGQVIRTRGFPVKFSHTIPHLGLPPRLGEHQHEVLRELGYTDATIDELTKKNIF